MSVNRDRGKPTSHTHTHTHQKPNQRRWGKLRTSEPPPLSFSLSPTAGSLGGSYICFRMHGPVGRDAGVWHKRSDLCMLRTIGERHGWPCKNAFVAVRAHQDASSGAGQTVPAMPAAALGGNRGAMRVDSTFGDECWGLAPGVMVGTSALVVTEPTAPHAA